MYDDKYRYVSSKKPNESTRVRLFFLACALSEGGADNYLPSREATEVRENTRVVKGGYTPCVYVVTYGRYSK